MFCKQILHIQNQSMRLQRLKTSSQVTPETHFHTKQRFFLYLDRFIWKTVYRVEIHDVKKYRHEFISSVENIFKATKIICW